MPSGLFITFEGCEGSGKSTQAKHLHARVLAYRRPALLVHEPGSTPLGVYLRRYLKGKRPLCKEAELLLFEAARAQLVSDQIAPNLSAGYVVIADRFAASSIAYQGYGRKMDVELVRGINDFATNRLTPHITFLLDIEPTEGLKRVGEPQQRLPLELGGAAETGRQDVEGHRRFEDQDLAFHARVRKGYLDLAKERPEEWRVIDASLSEEEIGHLIWNEVGPLLSQMDDSDVNESRLPSGSKNQPPLLQ